MERAAERTEHGGESVTPPLVEEDCNLKKGVENVGGSYVTNVIYN